MIGTRQPDKVAYEGAVVSMEAELEFRKRKELEFHDRRIVARDSDDPMYGHPTGSKKLYVDNPEEQVGLAGVDVIAVGERVLDHCSGTGWPTRDGQTRCADGWERHLQRFSRGWEEEFHS